jgi:hypothetical protein
VSSLSLVSRAFAALRAGYGGVLLCAPGAVIGVCTGRPASPAARTVVRVLGARHLAQAAVTAWSPGERVLLAGTGVDLAHAASMLALAAARQPLRQAELADGLIEFGFAALGFGALRFGALGAAGGPGR